MKQLQTTSETYKTFEMYTYHMCFQRNISLILGRNGGSRHLKFIVVELTGGAKRSARGHDAVERITATLYAPPQAP
jgi:hypothetical protein